MNRVVEHRKMIFSIEGKWYTWLLRHLWVEGNETKAVRFWCDAFPGHDNETSLNKFFLPVVTGKAKLVGTNNFEFKKDKRKCWDPDQSGKDNPAFPLLQSWEDVFLYKRIKLFVEELHLRQFRLHRRYGETKEENLHSLNWLKAVEENKVENTIRSKVNSLYTDIRNLSLKLSKNIELEMLPTDVSKRIEVKPKMKRWEKSDDKTLDHNFTLYEFVVGKLTPIQKYFHKKYKTNVIGFVDLESLCGLPESEMMVEQGRAAKVREKALLSSERFVMQGVQSVTGAIAPSLDSFIKGRLDEANRKDIEAEDPKHTKWVSGYIDRDGKFYGCSDLSHGYFAKEICEQFKIKIKDTLDHEKYLDSIGWVKVSMGRFYWSDHDLKGKFRPIHLTESQKRTIKKYMEAKNLEKTVFNDLGNIVTFEEAFK